MTPDIDDATLDRACGRLARALAPPSHAYVALRVDGHAAGWIRADRVRRVAACSDVFTSTATASLSFPRCARARQRTAAVAAVAQALAAEGALTAWRDERYAVAPAFGAPPWFELERAAARYFGVRTYAAHANGLVRDDRPLGDVDRPPQSGEGDRPGPPRQPGGRRHRGRRDRRGHGREGSVGGSRHPAGAGGAGAACVPPARPPRPARRPAAGDDLRARPVAARRLRAGEPGRRSGRAPAASRRARRRSSPATRTAAT